MRPPLRSTVLALAVSAALAIDTVKELNVQKYLGRWYQMYADRVNTYVIQGAGYCVTADYGLSDKPNTVTVHNAENMDSPTGRLNTIDGFATVPNPAEPGKLVVTLNGVPAPADYWVPALGPATYGPEGQYQWAIVTDSRQNSLFILARDPKTFEAQYEAEVLALVDRLGFNGVINRPIKTPQSGCTYEGHSPAQKSLLNFARQDVRRQIDTVDEVNVDAYVGRWYQMYANNIVASTFERNGYCATADYTALPDGTGVTVHNTQNTGSPSGPLSSIDGRATVADAKEPGKLVVRFDSVPAPGSYWIIKLGPIKNGQYQYSVVTDAASATLFILAREPSVFKEQFEAEVLDFVNPLFRGMARKPLETVQGSSCAYSLPPAVPSSPARSLRLGAH